MLCMWCMIMCDFAALQLHTPYTAGGEKSILLWIKQITKNNLLSDLMWWFVMLAIKSKYNIFILCLKTILQGRAVRIKWSSQGKSVLIINCSSFLIISSISSITQPRYKSIYQVSSFSVKIAPLLMHDISLDWIKQLTFAAWKEVKHFIVNISIDKTWLSKPLQVCKLITFIISQLLWIIMRVIRSYKESYNGLYNSAKFY